MLIDVSDGIGFCTGTVQDVSRVGLCLTDLAKRFGQDMDTYTAVASSGSEYFKFRVRPRWEQAGSVSKRMGVEITEPSGPWMDFVSRLEAKSRKREQQSR